MKKITYRMKLLSSLIVSPRAGQAFYYGINIFCREPVLDLSSTDSTNDRIVKVKAVYPFYQYGTYEKYDPDHAAYYLPGSSVKGALLQNGEKKIRIMVDDIPVERSSIVLRNLVKAQYVNQDENAAFVPFFDNIGVEMVKAGTELQGELYLEDNVEFQEILKSANKATRDKMGQMLEYMNELMQRQYKKEKFNRELSGMMEALAEKEEKKDVILVGGYKGLLHSILRKKKNSKREYNRNNKDLGSSLFLDCATKLPHGLVEIFCESEVQVL